MLRGYARIASLTSMIGGRFSSQGKPVFGAPPPEASIDGPDQVRPAPRRGNERRLAAILAADVVGYSLLMEQDEAGTLAKLKDRRGEILAPLVAHHRGLIVKVMGDGVLVEYASAVNALDCAVELQKSMSAAAAGKPEDRRRIAHDQPAIQASRSKRDGSVRTSRTRQRHRASRKHLIGAAYVLRPS